MAKKVYDSFTAGRIYNINGRILRAKKKEQPGSCKGCSLLLTGRCPNIKTNVTTTGADCTGSNVIFVKS